MKWFLHNQIKKGLGIPSNEVSPDNEIYEHPRQ
jgi:hypothetical protein